jgi:hypothetical protein
VASGPNNILLIYISDEQLYTMELCVNHGIRFKFMVSIVNAYLRCVNSQEARGGVEGINRTTGCGQSNARGGVMER